MSKKVLDFIAALCFCFDVDWDSDFADDEYCLERRKEPRSIAVMPEASEAQKIARAS